MNLRDLRYLVALADLRHFGRAAEASFVSQPTLSTQVKKLEEELGVALVERSPRKVMLTATGKLVAERARGILREVDQIREAGAPHARTRNRASCAWASSPRSVPTCCRTWCRRCARASRGSSCCWSRKRPTCWCSMLHEGKLDAAGLALPLHDEQLHTEFLFEEPFLLAVAAGP